MAQFNTIQFSYLKTKNRIDSEYYKYSDVIEEEFLRKVCKGLRLKHVSTEISERFNKNSVTQFQYNDIGNTDMHYGFVKPNIVNSSNAPGRAVFINKKDDVLISTVRPNRNANAILDASEHVQVGSNGFVNLRASFVNPNYLYAYSKTKYFINSLVRATTSSMYPAVRNRDALNTFFFKTNENFEEYVSDLVAKARELRKSSTGYFKEATELLNYALGFKNIEFKKEISYTALFSKIVGSHRLDSNHFKPKFNQLLGNIKNNFDHIHLGTTVVLNRRGVQPIYVDGGSKQVITSQHITDSHLDYDNFESTSEKHFALSPEAHVKYGDILTYTTGAYVGQTNVYLDDEPALASNHVNIIRLKGTEIDPVFVAFVMNSLVGKLQTEKHIRGSAQAELYPNDIAKFIIPILKPEIMDSISKNVKDSLDARRESKQLLEQAKHEVEQLIEQAAKN